MKTNIAHWMLGFLAFGLSGCASIYPSQFVAIPTLPITSATLAVRGNVAALEVNYAGSLPGIKEELAVVSIGLHELSLRRKNGQFLRFEHAYGVSICNTCASIYGELRMPIAWSIKKGGLSI